MEHPSTEQIKGFILAGLACEHLEIEGDGRHFYAVIVSSSFEGQRTLARQRAVYAVLGERIKEEIHALSMKTYTPTEWQNQQ